MNLRLITMGLMLWALSGCGGTVSQTRLDDLAALPLEERLPQLEELQAKHPDDYRISELISKARWETYSASDSREKIELIKSDLRQDPEDAILSKLLGDAYYDMAKTSGAENYLDSALFAYENAALKAPNYLGAVGSVGALYDEREDYDQAIYWYQRVLEIEPQHVPTLCNLGASHYNRGEYALAVDYYRDAIAIDPDSQDAHYNLGVAFAETHIYKEAIAEWHTVIAVDSTTAVAEQAATNANLLEEVMRDTIYRGGRKSRRIFNDPSKIKRETITQEELDKLKAEKNENPDAEKRP